MHSSIILIGPMRAGKTTVGRLLAEQLVISQLSLDKVKRDYYAEIGFDADHSRRLLDEGGYTAALPYWKPFEIHAVERVLQDYPTNTVIDFGAGHSVYADPALFERAQQALQDFPYVIFLTPTDDVEAAIRILQQRDLDDGESGLPEINEHFIRHPSNRLLAKATFYTLDQSPSETCEAIVSYLAEQGR